MSLVNLNVDQAAKDAVDEAAVKLDPMVYAAIAQALAGLKATLEALLVGRVITITIK